jgi:hypothetical protein
MMRENGKRKRGMKQNNEILYRGIHISMPMPRSQTGKDERQRKTKSMRKDPIHKSVPTASTT